MKSAKTSSTKSRESFDQRPLTEDEVIAAIRTVLSPAQGSKLRVGIGDDAAAWQPSRTHLSVISTDALVENVHFTLNTIAPADLGARALATALSDIAAMGARPILATIALGLSEWVQLDWICALYSGINEVALKARTVIAGGDIVRSPLISLCVTVVGEASRSHLARRGTARPGDTIAVTGLLGGSRAGLMLLQQETLLAAAAESERPALEEAVRRHRSPQPRLREGSWLAASSALHAMMDISDGLSTDLARMCEASGCAAEIEDIPASSAARYVSAQLGENVDDFALAGGEDFELLVAVRERAFQNLARRFGHRFGGKLHRIGRFSAGSGIYLRKGSARSRLVRTGWDHLSDQRSKARPRV